jgi:hypothetical protein
MSLAQVYKEVLTGFASAFGPVNLSGIQFDMDRYIANAEAEMAQLCPEIKALNKTLRKALDDHIQTNQRWSTGSRNTDPRVKELVGKMHDMAFKTETLHQVASHPLIALPVSYMASLAGYHSSDPLELTRWGEAKEKAEARLEELSS